MNIFVCKICNRIFGMELCTSAVDDPDFLPQHKCITCKNKGVKEDGDANFFSAVVLAESW